MRTIEIKLYEFNELSEESKENALNYCRFFQVEHEWWEYTYADAKNIGLILTEFHLEHKAIEGHFDTEAFDSAKLIMENHGDKCDTWFLAKKFMDRYNSLVAKHSDGQNLNEVVEFLKEAFNDDQIDLSISFLFDLKQAYLSLLQKEYDYQTSDEQVEEMIVANGYEFTEKGEFH